MLKKLACSDHNWFRKQHLHEVKSALRIRINMKLKEYPPLCLKIC